MSQYLESAKQGLTVPSKEELQAGLNNTLSSAQQTVGDVKSNVKNTLNEFSSTNVMNASNEFLTSNSIVAKFAFLLLVLVVFIGALNIGIMLVAYLLAPTKQPYLVKGLLQGNVPVSVRQDPSIDNAAVVYRSNNRNGGIELTWSVWLFINTLDRSNTFKHSHIFNKGNNAYSTTENTLKGIATVNNSPGVYIDTDENGQSINQLLILMDVLKITNGEPEVSLKLRVPIPLVKWHHLAIRVQNYTLECYLNGTLSSSVTFGSNVPKQNYDDVHINQNGGFNGSLSNLRYYDYALSAIDINAIYNFGPNLSPSTLENKPNNTYDYLSTGWYRVFR
jgi:hypothetical protein